jgi:hypothetical protein
LESTKEASMSATLVLPSHIYNISRQKELLNLESPFYNIHNIFNLTSIIGDNARINSKWYQKDDNITNRIQIYKINQNSIIIKDSKHRLKEFFINK